MTSTGVATQSIVLDAVGAREALNVELQKLLETSAHYAEKWYGATFLLIDRTADPQTAEIKACIPGTGLVDLWDLNFMLWDEAHWAATRLVPAGGTTIAQPYLHRD